ncbi:MAG: DUF1345 domain-containing protein [Ilumatobacteraceae bacterium]
MVPSIVVPTALGFLIGAISTRAGDAPATTVGLSLLGWNVFVVVYVILTIRTFSGLDGAEFRVRMAARDRRRRPPRRPLRIDPHNDGPTFAIESSIVAFAVVLVLPHIDPINLNDWLLVPASISILLSCWGLSIVSYALHYARHDLTSPALAFPGDRTNAWADYVYFAIAVATTFGATDVSITTPHMRRVVNLHVILTFIYNSVIVALLAALLIR